MNDVHTSLDRLRAYVERESFTGYDPYDALNSPLPWSRLGKWPPILAIQTMKRLPVNVRPALGITRGRNPKGIGLFLHGYATLYCADRNDAYRAAAAPLFEWLTENQARHFSGPAWGYDFPWASPLKHLPAFTPSIVVTSFVGKGMLAWYDATGDERALQLSRAACEFVLRDLSRTSTDHGICFSYTPLMQDCCYNASLLGAELLALVYARTGDEELRDIATEAVDFVVAHQHDDGHWNYSLDPATGRERKQIDFHQGFLVDSLLSYVDATRADDPRYLGAIERGARFYADRQFHPDGRSMWRLPQQWPVDIHHQAQGIITFARLSGRWPEFAPLAHRVARWTIEHMQQADGSFAYRKGRIATNRIPYMRWGQAWMFLALATLIRNAASA